MSAKFQRITPNLWFDDQAEQAANYYVSIFENARIVTTTRYDKEASKASGRPEGSVMIIEFELDGQSFTALNGGPIFKFNEAISLIVHCKSQEELDHYWSHLTQGGDEKAQQCGWLKDRFGLSWQIVSTEVIDMLKNPDSQKAQKAMGAVMQMKKIDIAAVRRAADSA